MSLQRFGRYELLTELGRGGMAELHLARLSGIGGFAKLVAVKRMLPHLTQNKQFSDMFVNEGRIVARISHPNVCQVFEIGEDAGQLFLVMEYLEGVTWEELLRSLPSDPSARLRAIAGVLGQACEGLHHAHELQDATGVPSPVVHRDVSPQNLFVTVDGICKVLDFGVAKMKSDATHTKSGVLKGKIPYMSPEQLRGEDIDRRSDVFAAGILLWEALTGRHLFVREGEFQMWKAVLEDEIHAPSTWQPAYDHAVNAVVMRALERDRERRYGTIRELATALREVAEGHGGALTTEKLGELVRAECGDRLLARQVELATIERERVAADATWREAPTMADAAPIGGMVLRAEAVPLRARRRSWPLAVGVLLALVGVAVAVVVFLRAAADRPPLAASIDPMPAPVDSPPSMDQPDVAEAAPAPSVAPVTPEPTPVPKPSPPKKSGKRQPRAAQVDDPPPLPSSDPGTLSVGAEPTARVYLDGRFVEETPLYRYKLAPGHHELRLVPAQGAAHTRTIKIEPGKALNLGTLRW